MRVHETPLRRVARDPGHLDQQKPGWGFCVLVGWKTLGGEFVEILAGPKSRE